eukprot:6089196-Amphidinium_carterae.1
MAVLHPSAIEIAFDTRFVCVTTLVGLGICIVPLGAVQRRRRFVDDTATTRLLRGIPFLPQKEHFTQHPPSRDCTNPAFDKRRSWVTEINGVEKKRLHLRHDLLKVKAEEDKETVHPKKAHT